MIWVARQMEYLDRQQNSPLYVRRDEVRQPGQMYGLLIPALYGGGDYLRLFG